MLQGLPTEVIYHIANFLLTASDLANLSQTCRRLNGVIRADNWRIFRTFVQSRFPRIEIPPLWKDATQALTSRARALDRYGVVARVISPTGATKVGVLAHTRHDHPTFGYRPVIDSYEIWIGGSWLERREVLIWSHAAELLLRIRSLGVHAKDKLLRFLDVKDITSHHDVCGVHLLRPGHPRKETGREHFIFARCSGVIKHVSISPEDGSYQIVQSFVVPSGPLIQTSFGGGPDYILATRSINGAVMLYHTTHTAVDPVQPFTAIVAPEDTGFNLSEPEFLSPKRIAVVKSKVASKSSILVHDIVSEKPALIREIIPEDSLSGSRLASNVHAITCLASACFGAASPGNVFLAGTGAGRIMLYDLRSPKPYEKEYIDSYDTGPSYCILPFGHDRFLVGAAGNAVVKVFDVRMPTTSYSYTNAALSRERRSPVSSYQRTKQETANEPYWSKDAPPGNRTTTNNTLSIFVSCKPSPTEPRVSRRVGINYRGPIYAMSTPSTSSSTVYTGILDGLVRLDFASSDDLIGSNGDWHRTNIALSHYSDNRSSPHNSRRRSHHPQAESDLFNLAGYERMESDFVACLRSQTSFGEITQEDILRERRSGWDRRWRDLEKGRSWRLSEA